jgi:glyoxylase-like metal-dependent hydrolase (beta-lactamase superfamily II)
MLEIYRNVYHVGDSGCSVFLINTESEDGLVLIDCGMNLEMIKKISNKGLNPRHIKHCILTHFHIDHIAACYDLSQFNKQVKFYAHKLDAPAIEEEGHSRETAAVWYGVSYKPIKLEYRFSQDIEILNFGSYEFQCIHIPGHTPGSICILLEINNKKILFAQDVHGPIIPGISNFEDYQNSLKKMIDLKADILCEGHFGIFQPSDEVRNYIKQYIE